MLLMRQWLPCWWSSFKTRKPHGKNCVRFPDIDVALFEGTLQEVHEWLGTHMIDVGFVHYPTKEVESTLLTTDELHVFVSQRHRLRARTSVSLNELWEERLIMPRTGCEFPETFEQKRVKHGPPIRFQASEGAGRTKNGKFKARQLGGAGLNVINYLHSLRRYHSFASNMMRIHMTFLERHLTGWALNQLIINPPHPFGGIRHPMIQPPLDKRDR